VLCVRSAVDRQYLPLARDAPERFTEGVGRALYISAALAVVGALISWLTIRNAARVRTPPQPVVTYACQDPCIRERQVDEAA
jgi:hypothetical protein